MSYEMYTVNSQSAAGYSTVANLQYALNEINAGKEKIVSLVEINGTIVIVTELPAG